VLLSHKGQSRDNYDAREAPAEEENIYASAREGGIFYWKYADCSCDVHLVKSPDFRTLDNDLHDCGKKSREFPMQTNFRKNVK